MEYLHNKYFWIQINIEEPMPKWRRFLWRLLGFEYKKED